MFSKTVIDTGDEKPTYKPPPIDARINIIKDKIILRASRFDDGCIDGLSIKQINKIATIAASEAVKYINDNYGKGMVN